MILQMQQRNHMVLDFYQEFLIRIRDAFRQLKKDGMLCHDSEIFDYENWTV